jgi:hypothetical protein
MVNDEEDLTSGGVADLMPCPEECAPDYKTLIFRALRLDTKATY